MCIRGEGEGDKWKIVARKLTELPRRHPRGTALHVIRLFVDRTLETPDMIAFQCLFRAYYAGIGGNHTKFNVEEECANAMRASTAATPVELGQLPGRKGRKLAAKAATAAAAAASSDADFSNGTVQNVAAPAAELCGVPGSKVVIGVTTRQAETGMISNENTPTSATTVLDETPALTVCSPSTWQLPSFQLDPLSFLVVLFAALHSCGISALAATALKSVLIMVAYSLATGYSFGRAGGRPVPFVLARSTLKFGYLQFGASQTDEPSGDEVASTPTEGVG